MTARRALTTTTTSCSLNSVSDDRIQPGEGQRRIDPAPQLTFLVHSALVKPQRRGFSTTQASEAPTSEVKEGVQQTEDVQKKKKKPVIDSRVWPIAASTLVGGCAVGVLFPVMPIFAQELGLSSKDFGLVVSIVGFSRLVVNIPAAWLTDRYGRRFTLIGGPLISGLGMAFIASSKSLWELVGYRFLTGLGGSFQMTGAQMYLSDISTPENRARTMAPIGIAFATGATIGPAIGGYLSQNYGLQAPFFVVTTAIALAATLNYRLVPETRPATLQERKPVTSVLEEFKSVSHQWKPLLSHPDMRRVLGLHLTYWCVQSGCQWTLLPLIASSQFGFTASDLGQMFAMLSGIGIIGLGPAAFISDKFGRKATILPATLLVSGSLAMIPFVQTKEQLLMTAATYAIGATLFNSSPSAFVADITTEQTRGQALALLRSAGDAGLFIGAGGLGALSHATSSSFAFGCASTALILAGTNFVLRKNTGEKIIGLPPINNSSTATGNEEKKP